MLRWASRRRKSWSLSRWSSSWRSPWVESRIRSSSWQQQRSWKWLATLGGNPCEGVWPSRLAHRGRWNVHSLDDWDNWICSRLHLKHCFLFTFVGPFIGSLVIGACVFGDGPLVALGCFTWYLSYLVFNHCHVARLVPLHGCHYCRSSQYGRVGVLFAHTSPPLGRIPEQILQGWWLCIRSLFTQGCLRKVDVSLKDTTRNLRIMK